MSPHTPDAVLWTSSRMWQERVDDHWVLFTPDRRGLPVVVSDSVIAVLDRFRSGATLESVRETASAHQLGMSLRQLDGVTEFLVQRSFLRAQKDPLRYEARDASSSAPETFSVWLHINNHCNLDCAYCFVDKSHTEMSDAVMDQTISYLTETVSRRGIKSFALKYAGGEPTLSIPKMETFHAKLGEALRYVDCKWSASVLSNGTIMSPRLIDFLRGTRTGLSISLDGYGSAGHDIFRVFKTDRRGSWALIEKNIEKALAHGVVPYILATISQESAKTLPDLVRWIYKQGLKARFSIVRQPASADAYSTFREKGIGSNVADIYRPLLSTMNAAFEEAFAELEKESYEMDLRSALSICELHFESPSFSSCCGIGINHVVINERGEVASCPMTVHRDTVPIVPDVLESTRLTFSRYKPSDREHNEGKNCLDCRWFPVCVSGCPINNLAVNDRPFSVSPLNPFYEYVIPRYIGFFARKLRQSARRRGINEFLVLAA